MSHLPECGVKHALDHLGSPKGGELGGSIQSLLQVQLLTDSSSYASTHDALRAVLNRRIYLRSLHLRYRIIAMVDLLAGLTQA